MGTVTNCFRVYMVSTYYIEKTRATHFLNQTVLPPSFVAWFAIIAVVCNRLAMASSSFPNSCAPNSDPRSSKSYPNLASIISLTPGHN